MNDRRRGSVTDGYVPKTAILEVEIGGGRLYRARQPAFTSPPMRSRMARTPRVTVSSVMPS